MVENKKEVLLSKEKEGQLAHIELSVPDKGNALSLTMIKQLCFFLEKLRDDKELRLVLLSGKGKHFCLGGDLRWMLLNVEDKDQVDAENLNQVRQLSDLFQILSSFPLPVLARVQGGVYGGGLGLLSCCDVVLAHKDTKFSFSEVNLGLVPSLIMPYILRKIPRSFLTELMLTGRAFSVEEALMLGFVHFFGEAKEVSNYKDTLTQSLLKKPLQALKETKRLLRELEFLNEEEGRDLTIQTLFQRRKDPLVCEKIEKFLEKKKVKS